MAKDYQERLISLVRDTVTLLCKNGLEYSQGFCVEGLLGVTLDSDEVFLIPIKEFVADKGVGTGDLAENLLDSSPPASGEQNEASDGQKPERKKRRHHDSTTGHSDDMQDATQVAESSDCNNGMGSDTTAPSPKKSNKTHHRSSEVRPVKEEEDIVVIKEEIDDREFLNNFRGGNLEQNSLSQPDHGDSSMTFLPQPGTSQGTGINFSLDQLARDSGLPGAVSGILPPGPGGDTSWLQHSQNEVNESQEWQNQKHQWQCSMCTRVFGRRSWLKRHTDSVHLKLRLAECDICGKAYSNKGNLNAHRRAAHSLSNNNNNNAASLNHAACSAEHPDAVGVRRCAPFSLPSVSLG